MAMMKKHIVIHLTLKMKDLNLVLLKRKKKYNSKDNFQSQLQFICNNNLSLINKFYNYLNLYSALKICLEGIHLINNIILTVIFSLTFVNRIRKLRNKIQTQMLIWLFLQKVITNSWVTVKRNIFNLKNRFLINFNLRNPKRNRMLIFKMLKTKTRTKLI